MMLHIQYSTDKKLVQLPVQEWEALMRDYEKLKNKIALKKELKSAFVSIKKIQAGLEPEISLEEFLNEN